MIRVLAALLGTLLSLLFIICLMILLASYTSFGTKLALQILPHVVPGQLTIKSANGALATQIKCNEIEYRHNDFSLSLASLTLNWSPTQLFSKTLFINNIVINNLSITPGKSNASTSIKLPRWFPERLIINNFRLCQFQWLTPAAPTIKLDAQGQCRLEKNKFILNNFLLSAGKNQITANLKLRNYWQGQWRATVPDLSTLLPHVSGSLFSAGYIEGAQAVPVVNLSLQINQLSYKQLNITKLNATLKGDALNHYLNAQCQLPQGQISLRLQGSATAQHWWQGTITQFNLNTPTLGQWQLTSPATLQWQNRQLSLQNAQLKSNVGNLRLEGIWQSQQYWLKETGTFPIKALGITLSPLQLQLQGTDKKIQFQGTAVSGQGTIALQGSTLLSNKAMTTQANIQGNNFLAMNTHDYQIWITPKLTMQFQNNQWQLMGNLFVPKANLTPPDFSNQTETLSNDVVLTDEMNNENTSWLQNFSANIQLKLGNPIHVDIEGLAADVTGNLQLLETSQRLTTANGILVLNNGTYTAYNQKLTINNGRLLFNQSSITNPGLEIRASKQIKIFGLPSITSTTTASLLPSVGQQQTTTPNPILPQEQTTITVGANVSGTLMNPEMTLFSQPIALSQTDILAYLLFGHAANQLSPMDAQILLQATSGLPLKVNQIEQVTNQMKKLFSLDEFNIQSTNYVDPTNAALKQNTSLILAKALSPKLYVSYSVGLLNPVNVFTIQYMLSSKWSLQSTDSTFASGIDLFYTLQRD